MLPNRRFRHTLFGLVVAITLFAGCSRPSVVVYTALDREFSEPILNDFSQARGVTVLPKYDTEANKSVSLYQDLVREAERPRCDVHWNNEILSTIRLQKKGLLQPYASPNGTSLPASFRAKDHTWHAFAARARIIVINTKLLPKQHWPKSLWDLTDAPFRGRVAMAKPQFGTTATHAACLFAVWGGDKAREFYRRLRANGVHIVPGNKQVAEGVGQGRFAAGMTDTDDAMAEVRAGRPVHIIFPDQEVNPGSGTLFIPNTVALIRGAPHPDAAKAFIDHVLDPATEIKLTRAKSCQIPLHPNVKVELPVPMQPALTARKMAVDFYQAAEMWEQTQQFLTDEFAR